MSPALAVSRATPEKALEGEQRHCFCLPTPAPTLFAGRAQRVNAPLTWAPGDRTGNADDRPGSQAAPSAPTLCTVLGAKNGRPTGTQRLG